jgi:hypothetical protein
MQITAQIPMLTPLAELQAFLEPAGFSTWLNQATEQQPAEFLLVELNQKPEHEWVARLLWLEELEAALVKDSAREVTSGQPLWHLECLIRLPLDPGSQLSELRLLGSWLSAQLPFGVYLCDAEQGLCFRHVLLSENPYQTRLLVVEMLELCLPALRAHYSRFQAVCNGQAARAALDRASS